MNKYGLTLYGLGIVCYIGAMKYCDSQIGQKYGTAKENMEYIKSKAPQKYIELLEHRQGCGSDNSNKFWAEAAKGVRDSIRIDSIAKSNYAKGLQMAKDSLKAVK